MSQFLGKFDFVLVILQSIAVQALFTGVYRLYVAYNEDKWDVLFSESVITQEHLSHIRYKEFVSTDLDWKIIVALTILSIVILLNRYFTIGHINTVLVLAVSVFLARTGLFTSPYNSWRLDYYETMISDNTKFTYVTGGCFFLVLGLGVLWRSIVLNVNARR